MVPKDGFPQSFGQRNSTRSAWRDCPGHCKTRDTPSAPWQECIGKPPPVAWVNRRRALGSLAGEPHRPRDLYGSLSAPLDVAAREPG